MKPLPEKTIERLSEYRRTLNVCVSNGQSKIFSHELAALQNITAVQVRRDIMFLGYSTNGRKGYDIKDLIRAISQIIDPSSAINAAVVGFGHFGKAVSSYFIGKKPNLNLVAAFDLDPRKIGKTNIDKIECFSMERLREIVIHKDISIAIMTVPTFVAQDTAKSLALAGIKGILNFTGANITVPEGVFLESYDMVSSMEKVAYFVNHE